MSSEKVGRGRHVEVLDEFAADEGLRFNRIEQSPLRKRMLGGNGVPGDCLHFDALRNVADGKLEMEIMSAGCAEACTSFCIAVANPVALTKSV